MKKQKSIFSLIAAGLVLFTVGCGQKKTADTVDAGEAQQEMKGCDHSLYIVDNQSSIIFWEGFKPGGAHNGVIPVSNGKMEIEDNQVISGAFEFDLNQILCKDLEGTDNAAALEQHLKSADFFDVENHPIGKFTITSVEEIEGVVDSVYIHGNLTLKGVEKNIRFKTHFTQEGEDYIAHTETFTIDRTLWGVNYHSKNIFKNLKDAFINDEIQLSITLKVRPN